MKVERISGVILTGHKCDALEVPLDPGAKWDMAAQQIGPGRRGYRVACRVEALQFDSCIVARSKKFWLLLSPEIEQRLSVKAGDTVRLSLEPA
ncbi:MAG TPA: DUF1905 domain-containing protein [Rudaea sp.]|nr:DUF1905 domain-containing protein [Rudaea sp.]